MGLETPTAFTLDTPMPIVPQDGLPWSAPEHIAADRFGDYTWQATKNQAALAALRHARNHSNKLHHAKVLSNATKPGATFLSNVARHPRTGSFRPRNMTSSLRYAMGHEPLATGKVKGTVDKAAHWLGRAAGVESSRRPMGNIQVKMGDDFVPLGKLDQAQYDKMSHRLDANKQLKLRMNPPPAPQPAPPTPSRNRAWHKKVGEGTGKLVKGAKAGVGKAVGAGLSIPGVRAALNSPVAKVAMSGPVAAGTFAFDALQDPLTQDASLTQVYKDIVKTNYEKQTLEDMDGMDPVARGVYRHTLDLKQDYNWVLANRIERDKGYVYGTDAADAAISLLPGMHIHPKSRWASDGDFNEVLYPGENTRLSPDDINKVGKGGGVLGTAGKVIGAGASMFALKNNWGGGEGEYNPEEARSQGMVLFGNGARSMAVQKAFEELRHYESLVEESRDAANLVNPIDLHTQAHHAAQRAYQYAKMIDDRAVGDQLSALIYDVQKEQDLIHRDIEPGAGPFNELSLDNALQSANDDGTDPGVWYDLYANYSEGRYRSDEDPERLFLQSIQELSGE